MKYQIDSATLTGMADAVRGMFYEHDQMTPEQMISKVNSRKVGIPVTINGMVTISNHINPATGKWERPEEYPDLDSIKLPEGFEGVYMTYDLRKIPEFAWIGVWVNGSSGYSYYVERGYLNNGEFIVEETNTVAYGSYFRKSLDFQDGDVQLWRIRPANSSRHISNFGFCTISADSSQNYSNILQPCVERRGFLDYCDIIWGDEGTGGTYRKYCTAWLERDALVTARNVVVTNFASVWAYDYNLQEIDYSLWDTSKWKVKSFVSTWAQCVCLQKLDLSHFDTSNWAVTNMASIWSYCVSLRELNISGWDTFDWAVTSIANTWNLCVSLEEIDISDWDTSNWAVTTMYYTWYYCVSLKHLDLSKWDTSNWVVTSLQSTWCYCWSLVSLDISTWDTSNWAVTVLANAWNACRSLVELNISGWDVSNWAVTTFASAWSTCESLKELDLNDWDVSSWTVTNMASAWSGCFSLERLEIGDWDVSNWAVTNMTSAWYYCSALKHLDIGNWDVSNWEVTSLRYVWYFCNSLRELDISDWDTRKWAITSLYYTFGYCYSLAVIDISKWDTSLWDITENGTCFSTIFAHTILLPNNIHIRDTSACTNVPNHATLINYTGFDMKQSHTYSSCRMLTRQSLLNIINNLPTVTASRTITLGGRLQNKLTAEEIAVATQKGWTVA